MKTSIFIAPIAAFLIAGAIGCSSQQTLISPDELARATGDDVNVRTIRYQNPMRWPKWPWWQDLTSTHPERWDVVVFLPDPQKTELRALRVVGLPGESLRFENGRLLVNNQEIALPERLRGIQYASGSYSVPKEHFFLLSDDPRQASDSRQFGAVQRSAIRSRIASVQSKNDP